MREKEDQKLDALVANSGLYRTFFTAGFIYLVAVIAAPVLANVPSQTLLFAFVAGGMGVFLFALRKEDGYIHSRIEADTLTSESPTQQITTCES